MARERTLDQKVRRRFVGAAQVALKKTMLVNTETTGRLVLVGALEGRKFIIGDVFLLEGFQCSPGAVQRVLTDQERLGTAATRLPYPQNHDIRTFLAPEASSVQSTGDDSATISNTDGDFYEAQSLSASQPNSSGCVPPPAGNSAHQPSPPPPIAGTSDWLSGSPYQYFDASPVHLEQDTLFSADGDPILLPLSHFPFTNTEESLPSYGPDSAASVLGREDKQDWSDVVPRQQRKRECIERLKSRNFFA